MNCVAASCTGAQLASYEVNDWITRISAALPLGDGAIGRVVNVVTGNVVTVTVVWDDDRSGAVDAADPNFVISTGL